MAMSALDHGSTGYAAVHARKARESGKAREHPCAAEGCLRAARDWAWDHTGPSRTGLVEGMPRTWGTDTRTYRPLCRAHHTRLDKHTEPIVFTDTMRRRRTPRPRPAPVLRSDPALFDLVEGAWTL